MTRSRLPAVVAAAALAACTLAACGGSSSKTSTAASKTTTTIPPTSAVPAVSDSFRAAMANVGPPAPSAFTLSLARGPQGIFEVGPNGHTLYYTSSDKGTTSSCTGGCALTWPALTSSAPPTGGPAIDMTQVGTANGQVPNQVTYFGHLLYYFSGDNNPGDTNGVGRPGWFLLGPRGNQMVPR